MGIERPAAVGDFNRSESQAREFLDMVSGLWLELIDRMFDLEFDGKVYPSNAVVDGFAIRSCIVNFRTEADQMETLVADTIRFGRQGHAEMWAGRG